MNIATIYQIKNIITNDCYIGSTTNFSRRKNAHFSSLRKKLHHSIVLQRAFMKYGEKSFIINKIKVFPYFHKEDILINEQYYLNRNKCKYNICKTAGSQLGSKRSEEFKKQCSKRMKGKSAWNKGKSTMTIEQKEKMRIGRLNGKKREITEKLIDKIRNKVSKAVLQFDKNGAFIKEWKSLKEVSINLPCSHTSLSSYINGKSNIKTFKNYIWKLKI